MRADREKVNNALNEVITEAIESMAFLETLPLKTQPAYPESVLWVSLAVLAPIAGDFRMVMEKELVRHLTEILYGPAHKEITEQHKFDLMAELLNTVAGRFLSEIVPSDESFRLGIPEVMTDEYIWPEPPTRCWHFQVEGMSFSVCVGGALSESLQDGPV